MLNLDDIRRALGAHQEALENRFGLSVLGIFGSYVRGEQREDSDLDLLVAILRPISLLELVGAELYLTEALGIPVELIPERSLRPELKQSILAETVPA
jgi:predicted nucleotidyltransferase